jgi:hypothetical protein
MAEPARECPAAPGDIRLAPASAPDAGANVAADIVELIMADHRRIGRLCSAVYDIARHGGHSGPDWMLGHAWQRLADVLIAHIQAEEETCYSSTSGAGRQWCAFMASWKRDVMLRPVPRSPEPFGIPAAGRKRGYGYGEG